MKCTSCGSANQPNGRFCSNCGARIETESTRKCQACGSELKPEAKFCAGCGNPVNAPVEQAASVAAGEPVDEPQPRRSRATILLPLIGIPFIFGIIYLLAYPRKNPEAAKPVTPMSGQMSDTESTDMSSMAPVFKQIDSLKLAVKNNPKDTLALSHLGMMFDMAGKHSEAAGYYRDILAVTPRSIETRMNLAGSYFNMGEHTLAIKELQTVLEQRPNYDFAMYNLGVIYAAMSQKEQAISWWHKVIAVDGNSDLAKRARDGIQMMK